MGIEKQAAEGLKLDQQITLIALKAFCSRMKSVHIYIYLVNTTSVNYAFYRVQFC